jgi:hypothetical protein
MPEAASAYRPCGFLGKLPGPPLVGLAPAQAIKLRAFSPNSSPPMIHGIFTSYIQNLEFLEFLGIQKNCVVRPTVPGGGLLSATEAQKRVQ